MQGTGKYDNLLKTAGAVALVLVVLSVLSSLFTGGQAGMGYPGQYGYQASMGHGGHNGYQAVLGYGGQYGYQTGFGLNGLIAFVLALALKILWLVLVVGLVVGAAVIIKKYLAENKVNFNFFTDLVQTGYACPSCGARLSQEYRFCPECGAAAQAKTDDLTADKPSNGTKKSGNSKEGGKTNE